MPARTRLTVSALEDRSLLSSYYSYAVSGSDFDYDITGSMPDFDQRRQANETVAGLPGDGGMYCAPTAAVNAMAFLANRGFPALMPFVGAKVWQTANYNDVTGEIKLMGNLMGTDAADGTGGKGTVDGLKTWLNALAPGKFDVYSGGRRPATR